MKPDIDLFELNEAFASVVLRYMQAFDIDSAKINVNGGAIALGHPLGATGAMILGTVLDELERTNKSTALITLCIGGGMGTATIIESSEDVLLPKIDSKRSHSTPGDRYPPPFKKPCRPPAKRLGRAAEAPAVRCQPLHAQARGRHRPQLRAAAERETNLSTCSKAKSCCAGRRRDCAQAGDAAAWQAGVPDGTA
jgi:hypothetical protein